MKLLYIILHVITISFPLIRPYESKIKFASKWKALWPGLLITATFFLMWDIIFTQMDIWGFNPEYTLGITLFELPVEEWLFFFTIPFACLFIYESVLAFFPAFQNIKYFRSFTILLGVSLVLMASINNVRAYTFWAFLLCGLFLLYIALKNPKWLGQFYIAYLFHLIPFFLVNGILTGSFIQDQVVWYNNTENLGIRLGTIPVEDPVYSMLLLLMNVNFYEWYKKYFNLT